MMVGMLSYASMGWPVLAVAPDSKRPAHPYNVYTATTDTVAIQTMMRTHPDCNIGVPAGMPIGAFVLDVDPRNGGFDSLAALELEHGELPETPRARTGGGGEHYLFRLPYCADNTTPRQLTGKVPGYPGIDVLSTGRYFLVAPSRGKEGSSYRWMVSPWMTQIATAPTWLLDLVVVEEKRQRPIDVFASAVHLSDITEQLAHRARTWLAKSPGAVSGRGGSSHTFVVARKLVHGFGLDEETALGLLREDWNQRCSPPWSASELQHKVRQALTKSRKMPVFQDE